ncbi:MAG: hypothetical protein IKI84_13495 [Clostridia bacterium]|nr:hypothetical protein [Clostridia bacterium]
MNLKENPFAVLKASPRDNRHILAEKADEASLLEGAAAEEALAMVMQMNRRIEAELGWFPGTDPAVCETFLRYTEQLKGGASIPVPSVEGLGCPLAQANALAAFFEAWPDSRPELFVGLCRSMDRILSQVTAAETMNVINEDRIGGGWEAIRDESVLFDPLESRLRELAQVVRTRMERIAGDQDMTEMLCKVLGTDIDRQGSVARAASDVYILRIHDREEELRTQITEKLSKNKDGKPIASQIEAMMSEIETWGGLTKPLRWAAGETKNHAEKICHDMRNCIVQYCNTAPATTERRSLPIGNQIRTVTYQSKSGAFRKAIAYSKQLADLFPEQHQYVEMLRKDREMLEQLIRSEDNMVTSKLINGR